MQKINDVKKVSILGIIANTILLVIKLIVGIISKSQSMLADGIHSVEDSIASILSYIGANFSAKQKDNSHPYGHKKIEYVFSFLVAITMILSSLTIFKSIISNIVVVSKINFSIWLIIVCIINIVTKLILFVYAKTKYTKTKNILIKASMEDHRNDIFLTTSTLIGVTCGYFNIYIIDLIVGILIASRIVYIGLKIFIESFMVLIDTGLNNKKIKQIYTKVKKHTKDLKIIDILSKPIGNKYILIIKINTTNNIPIKRIKKEIKRIKKKLKQEFKYIYEVIIDFDG